jgi:hypothetical protein
MQPESAAVHTRHSPLHATIQGRRAPVRCFDARSAGRWLILDGDVGRIMGVILAS